VSHPKAKRYRSIPYSQHENCTQQPTTQQQLDRQFRPASSSQEASFFWCIYCILLRVPTCWRSRLWLGLVIHMWSRIRSPVVCCLDTNLGAHWSNPWQQFFSLITSAPHTQLATVLLFVQHFFVLRDMILLPYKYKVWGWGPCHITQFRWLYAVQSLMPMQARSNTLFWSQAKHSEHINIVTQPLSPSIWRGLCSKCRLSLEYECKLVGLERIHYQVGIDNGVCNLGQPQTLNGP